MKRRLFFLCLLLPLLGFADVKPEEAGKHLGHTVTVTGTVAQVIQPKKTTFINFGAAYPNHVFSAAAFNHSLEELRHLEGKTVSVTGKVTEHKGKPEIEVTSLDQIKVK